MDKGQARQYSRVEDAWGEAPSGSRSGLAPWRSRWWIGRVSRRLFQEGTNEAKYCLGFRNDHCPCSSWHKAIICNLYSCTSPLGRWDSLRASSQHVWITAEN